MVCLPEQVRLCMKYKESDFVQALQEHGSDLDRLEQLQCPDLKEFYRANMPMEIKEVGRGSIKPNVSNTYVIPAIGADSDTSDPYEWNPSSAAISTFLSAINSSRARFEIAFSVPSVQGIVPLTLDSDAELSVTGGTRTAVTRHNCVVL